MTETTTVHVGALGLAGIGIAVLAVFLFLGAVFKHIGGEKGIAAEFVVFGVLGAALTVAIVASA